MRPQTRAVFFLVGISQGESRHFFKRCGFSIVIRNEDCSCGTPEIVPRPHVMPIFHMLDTVWSIAVLEKNCTRWSIAIWVTRYIFPIATVDHICSGCAIFRDMPSVRNGRPCRLGTTHGHTKYQCALSPA